MALADSGECQESFGKTPSFQMLCTGSRLGGFCTSASLSLKAQFQHRSILGHSQGAAPSPVKRDRTLVKRVWNPASQARSAEAAVVGEKGSLPVQGRNGDTVNVLTSYVQKALSMPSTKMMSR